MNRPIVSFEFFPPRDMQATFRLWDSIQMLAPLEPRFVSVTYGAGGKTRALTHEAVQALNDTTALSVAPHLTCVDATRAETLAIARDFVDAGVNDLVVLRGDPPAGTAQFTPHPDGFANSVDLIAALKAETNANLRVAAYPDAHPESRGLNADIDWLKAKLDAGASEAITQFFFDAETFLRFRDACAAAGIHAPIIPGILPIENWANTKRFAARCGAKIPSTLDAAFSKATRDGRSDLLAIAWAAELCDTLLCEDVEGLHFYTLNRPQLTHEICQAIGVRPRSPVLENVA
jgi:methylenetetrahydrofolate reductase (NADPH)